MNFELQPILRNALLEIIPLQEDDFEILYTVASDPLIWEQHPNKERYQREVFKNFFRGAIESGGAFLVYEKSSRKIVGSSRFYELDEENQSVCIGYTFIGREFWGKGHNSALKTSLLEHAFQYVNKVQFHIGAENFRSQKAIEKIGAKKVGELEVAYYGEALKWNYIYQIDRAAWVEK